jgi:hypothetical protein
MPELCVARSGWWPSMTPAAQITTTPDAATASSTMKPVPSWRCSPATAKTNRIPTSGLWTFQRYYEDGNKTEIFIAPYDRLYLDDETLVVPHWELYETSPTARDRLSFPVVHVQDLMDSDGNSYAEGTDFEVRGGYIHWGDRRPRVDPETGGIVCAVRYTYRPFWYVSRLMHQIRFAQVPNVIEGSRPIVRMPHAAQLVREYAFRIADNDVQADDPTDPRQAPSPRDGSFGGQ